MENNEYSVNAALHDAGDAREATAARFVTPPWYHPGFGAALAAICLGVAFGGQSKGMALLSVAGLFTVAALPVAYRKRYGIWISPSQAGPRARPAWVAYSVACIAAVAVAVAVRLVPLPAWPAWVAAVVTFVVPVLLGPVVDRRLRDDIRAGDATVSS